MTVLTPASTVSLGVAAKEWNGMASRNASINIMIAVSLFMIASSWTWLIELIGFIGFIAPVEFASLISMKYLTG
jgi:hypothetical protein